MPSRVDVMPLLWSAWLLVAAQSTAAGSVMGVYPAYVGGSWGFVDQHGAWVMIPQFDHAWTAGQQVGCGSLHGVITCLDATGRILVDKDLKVSDIGVFQEGVAPARSLSGPRKQWGFVSSSNRWTVEPRFDSVRAFAEGLAAVQREARWSYIDQTGQMRIGGLFSQALTFSQGLAAAAPLGSDVFGYITHSGEWQIKPRFKAADGFHEGLAAVQTESSKWGFIDREGQLVVSPSFDKAARFDNGLAPVCSAGRCWYIRPTGKRAFAATFDDARPYSNGMAAVRSGRYFGYINQQGEYVVRPAFVSASDFDEAGVALVMRRDASGLVESRMYIDMTGSVIQPSQAPKPRFE